MVYKWVNSKCCICPNISVIGNYFAYSWFFYYLRYKKQFYSWSDASKNSCPIVSELKAMRSSEATVKLNLWWQNADKPNVFEES